MGVMCDAHHVISARERRRGEQCRELKTLAARAKMKVVTVGIVGPVGARATEAPRKATAAPGDLKIADLSRRVRRTAAAVLAQRSSEETAPGRVALILRLRG